MHARSVRVDGKQYWVEYLQTMGGNAVVFFSDSGPEKDVILLRNNSNVLDGIYVKDSEGAYQRVVDS